MKNTPTHYLVYTRYPGTQVGFSAALAAENDSWSKFLSAPQIVEAYIRSFLTNIRATILYAGEALGVAYVPPANSSREFVGLTEALHAISGSVLRTTPNALLRGTIVNRTYGIHKNLYI